MQQLPYFLRKIEYYIREMFIANPTIENLLEEITIFVKNMCITSSDEKLLNFYFKNDASQEDLDNFLSEWDIEEEGGKKALALAYFMKQHQNLKYPKYVEPRLHGLLKYFKYRNLITIAHFHKICTALKKENIDVLIMKGGAIRHCNSDYPRIMGDIDILVPQKDYDKAKSIGLSFGYGFFLFSHSIDLYDPKLNMMLVDIHRKIDMQSESDELICEDFFKRAHQEKIFNVDGIYLPCPEDLMFILLINMNKNIVQNTSTLNILYYILDSMYILNLKPDFDWDIVKQNTIKTKTEIPISVMLHFLNKFVPIKLPEFFSEEFYSKCVSELNLDFVIS